VVELWREWIEEKAGKDLDRMGDAVENQQQFARTIRELLSSLDMAEDGKGRLPISAMASCALEIPSRSENSSCESPREDRSV
jgi:cobaltochelatase CobT